MPVTIDGISGITTPTYNGVDLDNLFTLASTL